MEGLLDNVIKYQSIITVLISLVGIFSCIYFISNRAGSSYSFIHKLWSLILGSKEFNNEKMAALWYERNDIEHFNTLFNTEIKTIRQLDVFEQWLRKYNIDIRIISKIRGYFDIETLKVRKVPYYHFFIVLVVTIVFFMSLIFIASLGKKNEAFVSFKAGGYSFWLSEDSASTVYNLFSQKLTITKNDCSQPNQLSGFMNKLNITNEQVITICKSFGDQETLDFIKQGIYEQRMILSIFFLIFLIITINFFKKLLRMGSTYDARNTIMKQLKRYRKALL